MSLETRHQPRTSVLKRLALSLRTYSSLDIGTQQERDSRPAKVGPLLNLAESGIFKIVVMGEVKKGKSSFINALLGIGNKLPVDSDIATSIVYKLVYGAKQRITVFFQEDDSGECQNPVEIEFDELNEYGTEKGNPNNSKHVEFIALELPCEFLKKGNSIVDTPGVGGLFKKHRYISYQYAPNADVVLFVVDSVESVMTRDDVSLLKELSKNSPHIVFLQTKTDAADSEQVEAWKARNIEIISDTLEVRPESIPYFLVSSKLKKEADESGSHEDLEDSGFLEFQQFLDECLLPARDTILARRLVPSFHDILQEERQLLTDRLSVARQALEGMKPELEVKKQELGEVQEELVAWQKNEWPKLLKSFRNSISDLERKARHSIEDATSPENSVPQAIADLKIRFDTAPKIQSVSEAFLAQHASSINEAVNDILQKFTNDFRDLCGRSFGDSLDQVRRLAEQLTISEPTGHTTAQTGGNLSAGRDAFFGSMFLKNASGAGLEFAGKLGVFKIPILLATLPVLKLGVLAGSIWAAVKFFSNSKERQVDALIRNLIAAMNQTCSAARRAGTRYLGETSIDLKRNAEESLEKYQTTFKESFQLRIAEIQTAIQRSSEENSRQLEKYKKESQQFEQLYAEVGQIWKEVSA